MQKQPPFWGTKILDNISIEDVINLINKDALFSSRWQFRQGQTTDEWAILKEKKILPIFEQISIKVKVENIFTPKIVYGYFKCKNDGNLLFVTNANDAVISFSFPRRGQEPHLCVADFFPDGFVAMQLVTIGSQIFDKSTKLFKEGKYSDLFYLKGFAAEVAEALAEYGHSHIRAELDVPETQGARFSFGYPALPNLAGNKKLYDILNARRIDVKITATYQMVPEYSTSAIISVDKSAKLFRS